MKKTFIPLFVGLLCWTGAHAKIIKVSVGDDLQEAIKAASPNDVIKVQAGTYQGNFEFKEGVNVSGGWNEDFTSQTDYATVLDANERGIVLNQAAAFSTLTIWENLTIQNGKTTSGNGAGVVVNKNGQIKHCHVTHNTSAGQGGGVFNDAVNTKTDVCADDCLIDYNSATHGAGVRIRGTIKDSEVANNATTTNAGGGIHLQGGKAVNCKVHHNSATGAGGIRAYGTCEISDCEIYSNSASTGPTGGVQLENGASIIQNCSVHDNTSAGDVGGVRMVYAGCKLLNSLICNNTAGGVCGGVRVESTGSDVIGNTIVGNDQTSSAENANGGHCGLSCSANANFTNATLANNIIWGNKHRGTVNDAQIFFISRYPSIANNAVYNQNTTNGIKLTAADPGFVDVANGKYALVWNSLLVNKGANGYAQGDVDIAGNSRIADNTVDIGAYECPLVTGVAKVRVGDDLQQKINYTAVGSSVKVQAGTFTGNFTMKEGVNVSGGWNDGFTEQDGTTILDGNASGRVLTQHVRFDTETTWSNFILQNGNASGDGGGARLHHNGVLSNCIITNNTASGNAGGVIMDQGGKVLNSKIISNNAGADAGGVRMKGDTYPGTLANCLVANNTAAVKTGGISLEDYQHNVYSNTIVNNTQTSLEHASRCGVRLNVGAPLEFANNIIWGNKADGAAQADQIELNSNYKNNKASYFLNNAIVLSTEFGTNTLYLTKDPFIKAADDTYYLNIATAADLINSGESSKAQGGKDLAGNDREQDAIDRGCYEQTMYSRTENVADGNYGTICLPFAVRAGSFVGAKVYKVESFATDEKKGLLLEEVDDMEAGKPYFFLGKASEVKFRYVRAGDEAAAGNENGLYGTISGTTVSGAGKYVLQDNELHPVASSITVGENKAYLDLDEVPDAPAVTPTLSPRRRVIGMYQVPTGMDQISYDQYTNKVFRNGQLLILRDGRTYNALGQLVD